MSAPVEILEILAHMLGVIDACEAMAQEQASEAAGVAAR